MSIVLNEDGLEANNASQLFLELQDSIYIRYQ
jgi:hypothetical protein